MAVRYQMIDLPTNDEELLAVLAYLEANGRQFIGFHPTTGNGLVRHEDAGPLTGRTACQDCRHYQRRGSDIWYDQYCVGAPPRRFFNPIRGCLQLDEAPQHCREINTGVGDCPYFEARAAGEAPREAAAGMTEELRTPNTVEYILRLIGGLGPTDRRTLFEDRLPSTFCMSCGSEPSEQYPRCFCQADE